MNVSGSNQFSGLVSEAPLFRWTKGQSCEIVRSKPLSFGGDLGPLIPPAFLEPRLRETVGKEHAVLVCAGEGEKYEPLQDEPSAYLHFAATFLVARSEQEAHHKAAQFVTRFGLPRQEQAFEDAYGQPSVPVESFLLDAARIADAVRLLVACERAERDGDVGQLEELVPLLRSSKDSLASPVLGHTGSLMLEAMLWLSETLTRELSRVRLVPLPDVTTMLDAAMRLQPGEGQIPLSTISLKPGFTCDDLLAAMWLQVYLAATEQRLVSLRCKGCRRPFEAKDRRQEYCDKWCRHATNQRSYYKREKEAKDE